MKQTINFKHSGNIGDTIYALTFINEVCKTKNAKANLYLKLNVPSTYTSKTHPVGDVMLNKKMFDMAKPLFDAIGYINEVSEYTDQPIDYDLDVFRLFNKNLSAGDIKLWNSVVYHDVRPNTSEQVISTYKPPMGGYVVINRTSRYNNPLMDYTKISELGLDMFFVGVESEYATMKAICPEVKYYEVKDFKEMAELISGAFCYFGNQSSPFAIAEQMKVRRVLEQYYGCPNVIPQGGEWYVHQTNEQFLEILGILKEKV